MLKVGTTVLPAPQKVGYSENKIWSQNTGRLDNGQFVGDLVAIKRKYELVFPPLTETQLATVRTAFSQQFSEVTITDMAGVTDAVLSSCYFGDVSFEAYSWNNGIKYATNTSVSIIER